MRKTLLPATIGMAISAAALAAPVQAAAPPLDNYHAPDFATMAMGYDDDDDDDRWEHRRDRYRDRRYNGGYYGEPVYRDTRVWRGNDGRYYCRKKNGTTGLIIGGAAGALLGREIDSRGDRALGTILGAAGGALLGREIDRGGSRCR